MSTEDENQEALQKLLENAQNGDNMAFEELILKYEKLIYNVAYRILQNPEDARDISQESLIKIYKNLKNCPHIKAFKNWSCAITTNSCIDYLRYKNKRQATSLDAKLEEESSNYFQVPSDDPSPEQETISKEDAKTLYKAINELSEKDKSMIVLRDINSYSYQEIAEIMDLNIGTVKSKISRARNKLKDALFKQNL